MSRPRSERSQPESEAGVIPASSRFMLPALAMAMAVGGGPSVSSRGQGGPMSPEDRERRETEKQSRRDFKLARAAEKRERKKARRGIPPSVVAVVRCVECNRPLDANGVHPNVLCSATARRRSPRGGGTNG